GSETYGNPSSRNTLCFSCFGRSVRLHAGRNPPSANSSTSSRVTDVFSVPPISAAPEPTTVTSTLGGLPGESKRSLAAEHWRRNALRCRKDNVLPSLDSASHEIVRSRLSPPSKR